MMLDSYVSKKFLEQVVEEDLGRGDLTTKYIAQSKFIDSFAIIKAKQELVLCGTDLISRIFLMIDDSLKIELLAKDGAF